MAEEKQEKLPLDAKLLSDAVMELNISRRSVGLYPVEHPLVKESIGRAYRHLEKLLEIRFSITLGIAKNALVIDEYALDKRNPVYREFAVALHEKGIAAVTFSSGLTQQELISLHELVTAKEGPIGKAFAEALRERQAVHIAIAPLDFSSFGFAEGMRRDGDSSGAVWEDYVFGLIEGRLGTGDSQFIQSVPPEEMAGVINTIMPESITDEAYDRVITSYMHRKDKSRLSGESLEKLFSFIDRLKPELKQQFLSRSCTQFTGDIEEVEAIIREMTPGMFERTATLFSKHASLIPPTLKHVIDKLSAIKGLHAADFDFETPRGVVLDDIEIGKEVSRLFSRDHSRKYVNEDYEKQLALILKASGAANQQTGLFNAECTDEKQDSTALEIMLELIDMPGIKRDDYLALVTKLSELMPLFVETGRFEAILETYTMLNNHVKTGRFAAEASGIITYEFNSIVFVENLVQTFRLWGRKEREGALKLFQAFRHTMTAPLLDALTGEPDASVRRFYLSALSTVGADIGQHVSRRLRDDRWHVLRNMLYLIRECRAEQLVADVRRLLKHDHPAVAAEALRTLIEFKTADSIPHLKALLRSENAEVRRNAIRIAAKYRIADAVENLVAILNRRDILGTETRYKADAIKALGEIGDPRAVPALAAIVNEKSFFPRKGQDLKLAVFQSLDGYPPEAVHDLVSFGLTSGNEEIRSISERISARPGREGERQ